MTANSFDWDDELPPETGEEVYRALRRALQRKEGFGLFFVQCSKTQGENIVADLRQDLPQQQIRELHLQGEVTTLYDKIAALWEQQPFDVLVVEGLEASLYAYEDVKRHSGWSSGEIYSYSWKGVPKILNHLNQQRENLRNDVLARFVFLVPPFVVDYFIQRAADFLDWRSGLFRFPRDPREIAEEAARFVADSDYNQYLKLTTQERVEKIFNIKTVLQGIDSDPDRQAQLLFELGLLFHAEQDNKNAVASYDHALTLKPDKHAAWNNRGTALSDLGRKEEAIQSYDHALTLKPDYHAAWNNRGNALSDLGRKEEAIQSYDHALTLKPDDHAAWYNRGYALFTLGRKEEAIQSYDHALTLKPDLHAAWNNRGYALFTLGRKEEAIQSYDHALTLKPDKHEAWNNRGTALFTLGRKEEAIQSYDHALTLKPDDHEAWNNRGDALFTLGRKEEAIQSYDHALTLKPDDHEAWNNRGDALFTLGRKEEAIQSYDHALTLKPDKHEAWNNRGTALSDLGRKEEALQSYDQAVAIKPDFASAYYNKACCYSLQGKIDLAIETLQHAISLDAKYRDLAKTDSDFDSIRENERFRVLVGE